PDDLSPVTIICGSWIASSPLVPKTSLSLLRMGMSDSIVRIGRSVLLLDRRRESCDRRRRRLEAKCGCGQGQARRRSRLLHCSREIFLFSSTWFLGKFLLSMFPAGRLIDAVSGSSGDHPPS